MCSPHSLGPWSVMQAALQGGAMISRPSIPYACGWLPTGDRVPMCARAPLLLARSWAAVGVASADRSISADRTRIIFIVRFLDCGPRATGGPLNSRLDYPWTSLVNRLELESGYSRTRKYW